MDFNINKYGGHLPENQSIKNLTRVNIMYFLNLEETITRVIFRGLIYIGNHAIYDSHEQLGGLHKHRCFLSGNETDQAGS